MEQETLLAKPVFDKLDLTHIQQYFDGTVKISFQNNQPLRINEGRHSFVGSESISKRDQDLNDFLQKNCEKPTDLKLKGASSDNSQVNTAFYSTKAEPFSTYDRTTIEEEETRSVSPSAFDFQNVETPVFQSQLRVLNVLNKNFEIDMVALFNEFISAKTEIKENTTRVLLLCLKKTVLKENGKKK